MMRGPPIAPPLPRPPPPPPMMLPPTLQGQTPHGATQPIQHLAAAPQVRTQRSKQCVYDQGLPRGGGEPPCLGEFSQCQYVCTILLYVYCDNVSRF